MSGRDASSRCATTTSRLPFVDPWPTRSLNAPRGDRTRPYARAVTSSYTTLLDSTAFAPGGFPCTASAGSLDEGSKVAGYCTRCRTPLRKQPVTLRLRFCLKSEGLRGYLNQMYGRPAEDSHPAAHVLLDPCRPAARGRRHKCSSLRRHRSRPGRGPCSGISAGPLANALGDPALPSRRSHQTRITASKRARELVRAICGAVGSAA